MANFNVTPEIKKILRQVDIKQYLIDYYDVHFVGNSCRCPHPDHDDHNPSFAVWTDDGDYYWCCHGCHVGKCDTGAEYKNYGNDFIAMLRWLSDYEGSNHVLTFQEAAIKACEYAGIKPNYTGYNSERRNKMSIRTAAAHGCNQSLLSHPESAAYKYLTHRGLDESDIREWLLGYNGERIVFPLIDKHNDIVAFSNRIIGDDKSQRKYVNSKTDDNFKKGEYLYGIHRVEANTDFVYITEGQMDVIAAYKFGLKNVVASLGTAFTEDHLGILKKYKHLKNLVFIFDSDEAGIKALYRSVMLARKNGFAASYVLLPEGMDLYDFAMKSKDALISEIRSRTKYFFFKEFEGSIKEYDELLFSMENRIMAKADSVYNSLSEETEKKMFTSFLKSKFNIDYKAGCG